MGRKRIDRQSCAVSEMPILPQNAKRGDYARCQAVGSNAIKPTNSSEQITGCRPFKRGAGYGDVESLDVEGTSYFRI